MSNVAVIGLGTMGSGMATNLLRAGHAVTVWNRTGGKATSLVNQGAREAVTIAAAVDGAEFVLYCLSDDAAVRAVALGGGGIAVHSPQNAIVIDLSTIDPETSAEEAAAYAARGIRFLDAPVFGTRGETERGALWVVVGGEQEDFETAREVLEPISETLHYMGDHGNGTRMKLVGNLLVAAQLESLGEALTLAKKSGLALSDVLGVLHVADFRTPIYDGVGASALRGDYSTDFALRLLLKDAHLIQAFARREGVNLPATDAVVGTIERAVAAGLGEQNASAFITVIANDAGVDLAD